MRAATASSQPQRIPRLLSFLFLGVLLSLIQILQLNGDSLAFFGPTSIEPTLPNHFSNETAYQPDNTRTLVVVECRDDLSSSVFQAIIKHVFLASFSQKDSLLMVSLCDTTRANRTAEIAEHLRQGIRQAGAPKRVPVRTKVLHIMGDSSLTLLNDTANGDSLSFEMSTATHLACVVSSEHRLTAAAMRKDGHPTKIDCLHYLLPGPPDWWNHLLYSNLLEEAATFNVSLLQLRNVSTVTVPTLGDTSVHQLSSFCAECKFGLDQMTFTCGQRAAYLISKHGLSESEAREAVMVSQPQNCKNDGVQ